MASRTIGGRRIKPAGGNELRAWYFMRYSGLLLVFLAVGHLFIMHVLNNVETINYAFVASRWAAPRTGWVWRLWDGLMISLAVLHGVNGLRQILHEYVGSPKARVLLGTALSTFAGGLILLGGYAIAMFREDTEYTKTHPLKNQPPVSVAAAAPHR